jgi:UDP-2-acetamido-2,6-beta-L-arabino-hexul-4-ose reductase
MKVLVTGSEGFIGKNLIATLRRDRDMAVTGFDACDDPGAISNLVANADAIVHLAGINRPTDTSKYQEVNTGFTLTLVDSLIAAGRPVPVIFSSSRQASLENDYGKSKREAEGILERYSERSGAPVTVFRFDNVFGKWSRPAYNSVIATFCYNAARGVPLQVNDPSASVRFIYIDDVVEAIVSTLKSPPVGFSFSQAGPVYEKKVGELAECVTRFAEGRKGSALPDVSDPFEKRLFSTYLSYVEAVDLSVQREKKSDERGWLFELASSPGAGQVFVSTTKPGKKRGNHWHDTKVEKFCLVKGSARISLRNVLEGGRTDFDVSEDDIRVVDIPPGCTHSLENTGVEDCVVIFWANEPYDPEKPDTWFLEV